jgi:uncharacterized protein DUF6883
MRIPGAERAFVDDAKIRDKSSLAGTPSWWPEGAILQHLGFSRNARVAVQQIIAGFPKSDAQLGKQTGFGQKYVVESAIERPDGRTASIVVVWIVLAAEDFPRFVTAIQEPIDDGAIQGT